MALIPADKTEPHEIAQLDLPLPRSLEDDEDILDWEIYVRVLPSAALLRKTAGAVDAWIRQAPRARPRRSLKEAGMVRPAAPRNRCADRPSCKRYRGSGS